jgi:hypothetical protein
MPTHPAALACACLVLAAFAVAQEPELLPERGRSRIKVDPAPRPAQPVQPNRSERPQPRVIPNAPPTPRRAPQSSPSPTAASPGRSSPAQPPRGVVETPVDEMLLRTEKPKVPDLRSKMGRRSTEEAERDEARAKAPIAGSSALRERDALDRLMDRVGGRNRFESLGRLQIEARVEGVDLLGDRVFQREFSHVFDPQRARSDQIEWSETESVGRSGSRVWSRSAGVLRPEQESRARAELETLGLLARFPFAFADRARFELVSEQRVLLVGRSYVRLRLRDRTSRPQGSFGPIVPEPGESSRHYDIYLDATEGRPLLLEIQDRDRRLRVLFESFREIRQSGVLVPMERILLGSDLESPRARIRWDRIKVLRD